MNTEYLIRIGIYVCAAAALIFVVEALYLAISAPLRRKRGVNRRLRAIDSGIAGEQALIRLKQERGILDKNLDVLGWLSRLLVQSGLHLTPGRFILMTTAAFIAVFLAVSYLRSWPVFVNVPLAFLLCYLLPLQFIRITRSRRQAAFTSQLPDALDVIVRSLRSGHPVPTAMGLVGREMPDPVGTEFGITIDEMTYGLDMSRALQNLAVRVGVPDLSLLVTAVSLQTQSGGNLSEVLHFLESLMCLLFHRPYERP